MNRLRTAAISGLAVLLPVVLFLGWTSRHQGKQAPWQEMVMPAAGSFDPDEILRISIGRLRFDIPNRDLAIPFPRGQKPFNHDVCEHQDTARLERNRKICAMGKQSVFFAITLGSSGAQSTIEKTVGTLGWNQGYIFEPELEAHWRSDFPDERENVVPELDTRLYAAFSESSSQIALLAKNDANPFHRIICQKEPAKPDLLANLICNVRIPYMEETFPRRADGTYPYTIEFGLRGENIDQVSAVAAAVKAKITSFFVSTSPKNQQF